jgi:hypothetical protein
MTLREDRRFGKRVSDLKKQGIVEPRKLMRALANGKTCPKCGVFADDNHIRNCNVER